VVLGLGATTLALFPELLGHAARATGVAIPFNLLLFLGILIMLVMIMQLSSESGLLRERTRILAEEVALLRAAVQGASETEAPGRLVTDDASQPREPAQVP
jgi:hypothetical protein